VLLGTEIDKNQGEKTFLPNVSFTSLKRYRKIFDNDFVLNDFFSAKTSFCVMGSRQFILEGSGSGLPDGLFSYQKSQFGYILVDLGMENNVIYYGHLVYFIAI
jgi:hypothetical protein